MSNASGCSCSVFVTLCVHPKDLNTWFIWDAHERRDQTTLLNLKITRENLLFCLHLWMAIPRSLSHSNIVIASSDFSNDTFLTSFVIFHGAICIWKDFSWKKQKSFFMPNCRSLKKFLQKIWIWMRMKKDFM